MLRPCWTVPGKLAVLVGVCGSSIVSVGLVVRRKLGEKPAGAKGQLCVSKALSVSTGAG